MKNLTKHSLQKFRAFVLLYFRDSYAIDFDFSTTFAADWVALALPVFFAFKLPNQFVEFFTSLSKVLELIEAGAAWREQDAVAWAACSGSAPDRGRPFLGARAQVAALDGRGLDGNGRLGQRPRAEAPGR